MNALAASGSVELQRGQQGAAWLDPLKCRCQLENIDINKGNPQ
jgi:hypothetical protein